MDIALAVEKILGVAEYGYATTYADLVRTWRDERPVPTEAELSVAWAQVQSEQTLSKLIAAVDAFMDSKAQARKYDNRFTFALRAAIPNSPWQAEGLIFANWMDAVNATCYEIMAEVQAGTRPIPTESELLAELPVLVLP